MFLRIRDPAFSHVPLFHVLLSLQLPLSFSHQYPSHLRSGVRILCGILLILTIVYVIPHLFDVGAGSAPSSSDPDFSFESSATVGVAAHSPVGSQNEVLRWKPSHGSLLPASDGPRLAAELGRLLAWPWAWLWPCHFFPPSLDDVAPFPPSRFGKDFDVHLTHPRSFGCSTRACRELCVDEELCAVAPLSSSPAPKGAGMGLLQVRLYQCGLVYGTTPASTWREHGLLPQRDTRTSCSPRPKGLTLRLLSVLLGSSRHFVFAEPPKPSLWSLVSAYIKLHFKRQLHYLRLGVVILFTLTGWLCVSCLVSIEILVFHGGWCAGDLEDVICAVLWPLFCAICRLPLLGIGPLKAIPDSAVMWSSLSLTLAFACVLCYGVLIVFPESLAELLRVACGSI